MGGEEVIVSVISGELITADNLWKGGQVLEAWLENRTVSTRDLPSDPFLRGGRRDFLYA